MTKWLVITLMAPLASFGERAGNVERPTADRPTRSALIGLAGAALGIRRADHKGQHRLAASFRVATASLRAGSLVSDFHTYQSLPSSSRPPPQTRAEALARRTELVTSITRREYRADVWHEAAYALQDGAHWKLEDLSEAFRAPRFMLSLGRKSCPLSAPLDPKIFEADDLVELFQRRADSAWLDSSKPVLARRHWSHRRGPIAAERREDLGIANRRTRQHRRHDELGDRLSWQFSARREFVLPGIEEEET